MRKILASLTHLFYPHICPACELRPLPDDNPFCLYCEQRILPSTFHEFVENPVMQRFWGRLPLEAASSFSVFRKDGLIQDLVHQLKYKGRGEVGVALGQYFGTILAKAPLFQTVQLIVPVPLHPKKKHIRGYNQAALFARGLSETMGVSCSEELLLRELFTESQTKKSRIERFENMRNVFQAQYKPEYAEQHILLVDDIITTGATLECCGLKLLEAYPKAKLSVAAIALA